MRRFFLVVFAALTITGCGKLGVGSPPSGGAGGSAASAISQPAQPTPRLRITSPVRGSFLATGPVTVTGQALLADGVPVLSVRVAGQLATFDPVASTFSASMDLVEGLNVLEATCIDAQGRSGATAVGVIAGTYRPVTQNIPAAGLARVNEVALNAAGRIAESGIWATDWTSVLKGLNPIYDTDFLWIEVWINVVQLRFRDVLVQTDAKTGGLDVTIDVADPDLDVTIEVDLGLGKIGPLAGVARADVGRVKARLGAQTRPDGTLGFSAQNATVDFQNFTLALSNGTLDAIVQLFAKNAIKNAISGLLVDLIEQDLPAYLDGVVADALQQQKPWDIFGKPFQIDIRGEQVTFTEDDVSLSYRFNAMTGTPTARALAAPGSFRTAGAAPVSYPYRGVFASLDDDGFNRALHTMWRGGVFDLTIDDAFLAQQNWALPIALDGAMLRRFLPEIAGLVPESAPVRLRTELGLPPLLRVTGAPDIAQLQAGEIAIDVLVDRGSGFEKVLRAVAHVELGGNMSLTTQGLQVASLSQPRFRFDLVDEPLVELDNRRLEVFLSVVLTPLIPNLVNSTKLIGIPHLNQLTTVNVDIYPDGPNREHVSIAADLVR